MKVFNMEVICDECNELLRVTIAKLRKNVLRVHPCRTCLRYAERKNEYEEKRS